MCSPKLLTALVASTDRSEELVPVGVVTAGMLATLLTVLARAVLTVDVIGLARETSAPDVVLTVELVAEAAMLLVLESRLEVAAAMLLAVCVVSVATLDTTGATALNPELANLPPFRLESVFESDEDSTFVVAETWLSIEPSVVIAPERTFARTSVDADGTDEPSVVAVVALVKAAKGAETADVTVLATALTAEVVAVNRLPTTSVWLAIVAADESAAAVKGLTIDDTS
jgi:hypothetical protein